VGVCLQGTALASSDTAFQRRKFSVEMGPGQVMPGFNVMSSSINDSPQSAAKLAQIALLSGAMEMWQSIARRDRARLETVPGANPATMCLSCILSDLDLGSGEEIK
jgi:hypothetical protein